MISSTHTWGRVAAAALVSGLSIATPQATGAQTQQSGKIIGGRLKTPRPFNYVRVPVELKAAATTMMQSLYDIVRRDTMFYEPVSFDVQPTPHLDVIPRAGYAPVVYTTPYFMFAYGPDTPATQPGRPNSSRVFSVSGNGNFLGAADKWQEDEKGQMYFEPTRLPDARGFPNYGKGLVVITKSERPLFLPAPLERTMRFMIAQNKRDIEVMKAPGQQRIVDRIKACVTKLEQELAAMSPAERAGPTFFSMTRAPGHDRACDPFSTANDKDARRIIVENPDFWDTKRPTTAIQVVFVNFGGFSLMAPDHRAQVERIIDRLDFPALAALTAKP